ncbi:MAG TPA: DUF4893 domain-containing protein [Allosphingosinicella sp.]|uniref:DUF4893 domain-containing protein n=1 Tax=Allosphingosinicella sp. TaxID=2823234 RepID=UPI002F2946A4
MKASIGLLFGIAGSLMAAGCQTPQKASGARPTVEVSADETPEWQGVANEQDAERIASLDAAWREALAAAGKQAAGEGELLDPKAALARPAPSPGSYMCRLIRFGSAKPREPEYQAFKPFFCHVGVNGDQLSITKQTGTERPAGYLWDDVNKRRMIFLGSLALGNEDAPLSYGEDPARDMAGIFERIGPLRYRLVVPRPRGTAKLDVIELVPAPVQSE